MKQYDTHVLLPNYSISRFPLLFLQVYFFFYDVSNSSQISHSKQILRSSSFCGIRTVWRGWFGADSFRRGPFLARALLAKTLFGAGLWELTTLIYKLLYALLPNKLRGTYDRLFDMILEKVPNFSPEIGNCDFELANVKSLRTKFPMADNLT